MSLGKSSLDEDYIYPVLFKGTTTVDYQMATFVLSRGNNVTMQELVEYCNEKEDTDASLRNYDPEKWDFDNYQDTQADEFDVDTPVHPFDDNYDKLSIHSICIQGKRIQKTSNHLLKVPNNGS